MIQPYRKMGTVGGRRGTGKDPGCLLRLTLRDTPGWRVPRQASEVVTMIIDSLTIAGLLAFVSVSAFLVFTLRSPAEDDDQRGRCDTCGLSVHN